MPKTQTVKLPDGRVVKNIPVGTTQSQLTMRLDTQFQDIVGKVLKFEGGYNDVPEDRGGATKYGISQRAYPKEDIKNLTKARAKELYYRDYYQKSGAGKLTKNKALLIFDGAVNHGVSRGVRLAQAASGAGEDGRFGDNTRQFIESFDDDTFADFYLNERKKFYDTVIKRRPSQEKFREGWYNRLNKLSSEVGYRDAEQYTLPKDPTPVVKKKSSEVKGKVSSNSIDIDKFVDETVLVDGTRQTVKSKAGDVLSSMTNRVDKLERALSSNENSNKTTA